MAKAFFVTDMPEKCGKCDLFICYRQYAGDHGDCFCGKTRQSTLPNDKPSWCPLKPMPEKDNEPHLPDEYSDGVRDGWNACIDAICGKLKWMEFDIYDNSERRVMCIRNDEDGMMVSSHNHHLLEIGKEYTVVGVEVHSWYTLVLLAEFPGKTFNSVVFSEISRKEQP